MSGKYRGEIPNEWDLKKANVRNGKLNGLDECISMIKVMLLLNIISLVWFPNFLMFCGWVDNSKFFKLVTSYLFYFLLTFIQF